MKMKMEVTDLSNDTEDDEIEIRIPGVKIDRPLFTQDQLYDKYNIETFSSVKKKKTKKYLNESSGFLRNICGNCCGTGGGDGGDPGGGGGGGASSSAAASSADGHPEEAATADNPQLGKRKAQTKGKGNIHNQNVRGILWSFLLARIPILDWLPRYSWTNDFMSDLIAGFTVAVMHIPQGMAYGILSHCDPIIGIYTAFFPVIIYVIFGTSPHLSMGTFAVVSILVSKPVAELSTVANCQNMSSSSSSSILSFPLENGGEPSPITQYCPIEVAMAMTITVGIIHFLMGLLRLGSLSAFLSEALVSGFTTGAAIHVFTSQVKHLLGLDVARFTGWFKLIKTYVDIYHKIPDTNLGALGISICCFIILVTYEFFIKQRLTKCCRFPFPIQLMVVILGTVVSAHWQLAETADVVTLGDIPTGLPMPRVPPVELIPKVIPDAIVCAVISYVISLSMAKILAAKHRYKIDPTQELYAMGFCNLFGSFFSSLPVTGSLSRSLVQDNAGGRSFITSVVSVFLLLWVLLFMGPLFKTLPNAVLAAIIVVALKGMFMQVYDFLRFARRSKLDGAIWMLTFLATVIIDIDIGLATGVIFGIFTIFIQGIQPMVQVLQPTKYLDINLPQSALLFNDEESENYGKNLLMIKLAGNLNFANCEFLQDKIEKATRNKLAEMDVELDGSPKIATEFSFDDDEDKKIRRGLVIDMSAVTRVDPSACQVLRKIYISSSAKHWKVLFSGLRRSVWNQFIKCEVMDVISTDNFYPTLQDALAAIRDFKS